MTKYLKEDKIDNSTIMEISNALKEGKLVVFPTDTVYGIGTSAYNKEACDKIYEVKGRPKYKPLIVLISNISMLKEIVDYILDCGDIESDTVSTIVQVKDEKVVVIREGKIGKEELEKIAFLK